MGRINKKRPAVFIDRDGTLIREKNYLRKIKDVRLISGAVEALRLLRNAGYKLFVITNQSGIARGYFTEKKLREIHDFLEAHLEKKGVPVDAVYYCPHHPDDRCLCRKPRLGLVKKAQRKFRLDLKRSFSIGDHAGDVLLGQNMGGKGIFVLTGHGKEEHGRLSERKVTPDHITGNILSAARWILRHNETK